MTNAHASKQHCLIGRPFPHSKMRKRRNKAKANLRKAEQLATRMAKREAAMA